MLVQKLIDITFQNIYNLLNIVKILIYVREENIMGISVVLLAYSEAENLKILLPQIIDNIEKTEEDDLFPHFDTESFCPVFLCRILSCRLLHAV